MVDLDIPIALHGFAESLNEGFGDPRSGQKPVRPWTPGETRRYVIQFRHSLFEDERRAMQSQFGLELEAYVPKFAYIERVNEQTVAALGQHDLVNGLFPLEAVYKQSTGIGEIEFRDPGRANMEGFRLWATLFSHEDLDTVLEKLGAAGAGKFVVTDDTAEGGVLRIAFTIPSLDPLREIAEIETVNWIEEAPEASANGGIPSGWVQTGSANAPITNAGLIGENEVVGVLDEHLLTVDHCWFSDPAQPAHGPLHRKMLDCHGSADGAPTHAAFVAGILCGEDLADATRRGIAYKAKMAYGNRLEFYGESAPSTLYQYLSKVKNNGATIINNSWHSEASPPYNTDSVATDRFAWRNERILIVGSASNSDELLGPPGSAKNALCVGAAYVDENGSCLADVGLGTEIVGGVRTGNVEGGRRKPDLLAPGCNIESADLNGAVPPCGIISDATLANGDASPGDPICDPDPVNHPAYCASSYATPVATAAAAIVRQYFRQGWHVTGNPGSPPHRPTAALLKAMLLNSTQQLTQPAGGPYPAIGSGWGLLQLDRVLRLPGEAKKIAFWDIPNAQGFFRNPAPRPPHTVTVNSNTQHLKVTLVWTEPPGDLKSDNPVVNNLDLVVVSPSATYLGNWFDPATAESAPDTLLLPAQADAVNNVEMVLVKQPEPGDWDIFVVPTEVNAGRNGQGYALVVRGDLT